MERLRDTATNVNRRQGEKEMERGEREINKEWT
jgi:hypothetical protein